MWRMQGRRDLWGNDLAGGAGSGWLLAMCEWERRSVGERGRGRAVVGCNVFAECVWRICCMLTVWCVLCRVWVCGAFFMGVVCIAWVVVCGMRCARCVV